LGKEGSDDERVALDAREMRVHAHSGFSVDAGRAGNCSRGQARQCDPVHPCTEERVFPWNEGGFKVRYCARAVQMPVRLCPFCVEDDLESRGVPAD
jgi:hypothetical protein